MHTKWTARRLAADAMFAAMVTVLGLVSISTGNLKITVEALPVFLGALLLGPVDGLAIGGVGTLLYQLLRFGVSATTALWIAPYVLLGLCVGVTMSGDTFLRGFPSRCLACRGRWGRRRCDRRWSWRRGCFSRSRFHRRRSFAAARLAQDLAPLHLDHDLVGAAMAEGLPKWEGRKGVSYAFGDEGAVIVDFNA